MIHINIGSNLSSNNRTKFDNILLTIKHLKEKEIKIIKFSSFYETPSYPNPKLPKYVNLGIYVHTNFDHKKLINIILSIEKKLGRVRFKKNEPRTCDIDIIDYKGLILNYPKLTTPHPRAHTRNFVLFPIREIDPNWIHPLIKKNVDFLINELSPTSRIEITRLTKSVIIPT